MAKNKKLKRWIRKRTAQWKKSSAPNPNLRMDLYKGKYERENVAYQGELDRIYHGRLVPVERYINPHASILHHCSGCEKEFFNAPQFLLERNNHDCGVEIDG